MPETTSHPRRRLRRLRVVAILSVFSALLAFAASRSAIDRGPNPGPVVSLILDHRGAEAEALAQRELDRAEREEGPGSLRTSEAIDGVIQAATASGDRASLPSNRRLAERAIAIKRRLLGSTNPEVARSLCTYAEMLWMVEDYRGELPLAEEALAIRIASFGPRDPRTAPSYYQVGEIRRMLGDYSAARRLHEQALSIWEASPERDPLNIAMSLRYLGMIRWMTGDYAGARALLERSLAVSERAAGPESDAVATSLNSLGSLALRMGRPGQAMPLLERAQRIWEKALGPGSPSVARVLENRGLALVEAGDNEEARDLFERTLEIRTRAFGPDHYLVARSLADLARLSARIGETAAAEDLYRRALEIQKLDPRARGAEIAETLIDDARLALAMGDGARSLDLALHAEGLARENFLLTSRGLPETEALRYETVRTTGLDVALSLLAPEGGAPALKGAGVVSSVWDELIRSRAMVLDEMAARDRPATSPAVESAGLKQAAESLPGGAALVAYVEYRSLRPGRDGSAERYLAFVMRPGAPPAVVPLGSASRIDALVRDWHVEAGTDPRVDPSRRGLDRYREAGRLLREAIWDPLASHVGDRDYVFIVPDGAIHLVSLAALPAAGDRYLIEGAARLHYLSAERDLAVPHGSRDWGHGVLAIGGADFDAAPDVTQVPDREATPACRTFESMRFDPLPGSKDEAEEVASLWRSRGDVQILAGSGAREAAFKLLAPGRRILHLATHGYSLQGPCLSELAQPGAPGTGDVVGDNPLLLSGLALAGANRRGEGIEDGILTAKEIGALDLSGVEWAVLSGCDTGTGTVVQGEGVLGLRRAFQVAGAATLIMSLWPVDDGAARLWMRHLYEARLAGKSTVASVNDASLEMLHEQRRLRRSTHPYYWGAFVAAGDWR